MPKEEAPALTAHQRQINTAISFCEGRNWTILAVALRHCWGNGFLDVFRAYFKDHAALFTGMSYGMGSTEHTLEQHECFSNYLKLYEDRLADYIEKDPDGPRASVGDFYRELAEAKEQGGMDPGTQEFIHCLVASADYDSFYSVMVREAQKLELLEAQMKARGDLPEVAEAKGAVSSPSKGGKGCDDDDDDEGKGYK
eukprot:CAMPEP_0172647040 /NCGR_PEP_ID=MMETSP1068-20121228/240549_1 /TAXON_ID=35684 /ORGANISM="Pseudopedinella elastica, Strain CCMP716" /LENGTH=196 /DNA_ID=CAMNT_0013461313 /DNA_START=58 /DNA_END=648 /DNA_ORIENTATION=-